MPAYTQLICDLFENANGRVTVNDINGESFTHHDLIKVGAWASNAIDPWLDLTTDEGETVGLFVAGDPTVVEPQPSFDVDGGMFYMLKFGTDPVVGQKQGRNIVPLDVFLGKDKTVDLNGLNTYEPHELDLVTPGSSVEVTLMTGRSRQEGQGRWKPIKSTFGQFTDILRDHKVGEKDGACYLQGESADGARKSSAQIANYILGVDLDSGAPLEDVMATIQKHGLEAVIYTTHSHLKDTSEIKRDHFMKKMAASDASDVELIKQYLMEWKGVLPHIVETLEVLDDAKHTSEGVVILVRHNPMPKFRAVFPLSEPFVFAKRGGSQQDAILEWKERYAGFCTDMGFFFDEKCVDPARLFYLPRHKKDDLKFGSHLIVGDALNLDKFSRVKINRKRKTGAPVPNNPFSQAGAGVADDDDDDADRYITEDGFNLRRWGAKHAKRFEIETMLEQVVGGDFLREPRQSGKPGVHVECPFEAEHSSFGGGGTFVVNAGDNYADGFEGGFTFNCQHNACVGRDRLDFLKELLDQGTIDKADLTNKDFLLELEEDEDDDRNEPEPVGVRKSNAASGTRSPDRGGADNGVRAVEERDVARKDRAAHNEDIDEDLASDDEDRVLRAFNRRYAVIRTSGGVRILVEPKEADDDVSFESQNDVALFEKNRVIWVGGGGKQPAKKMEAFKMWLEWEKRRTYSRVVFSPGATVAKDTYNLFRGWPFEPVPTDWKDILENKDAPVPGDWSMLRGHIYENICESDDELFNWFMTWLAMLFQKPAAKPGSTVVVTGEKGTGKSTVFDYVNQLLGRCGITVSQRKQIVGQFNGHLATTLLMVCEEAFWAADPQAEGVLKDMITNKSVLIEKKGYDPIQSQNYTRLALISNNEWVVPASLKDERRFFVLRCNSTRRGDLRFFEDMREQMEKLGGLEAFLHDLLTWEPINGTFSSLFNPPTTAHLQMQQIESLSGVQKFMLELVKAGIYETNDDNIDAIELNTDRETIIPAVMMRAAVMDYVKFRFSSDKAKTSYDDISPVVTSWFGAREVSLAAEGATNRKRTFIFPPLDEVRAKLKESKGLDIEAMTMESVKAMKTR